mgnify:CR=1 FL=1
MQDPELEGASKFLSPSSRCASRPHLTSSSSSHAEELDPSRASVRPPDVVRAAQLRVRAPLSCSRPQEFRADVPTFFSLLAAAMARAAGASSEYHHVHIALCCVEKPAPPMSVRAAAQRAVRLFEESHPACRSPLALRCPGVLATLALPLKASLALAACHARCPRSSRRPATRSPSRLACLACLRDRVAASRARVRTYSGQAGATEASVDVPHPRERARSTAPPRLLGRPAVPRAPP